MKEKEVEELSSGIKNTKTMIEALKCKDLSKDYLEGLFLIEMILPWKNLDNLNYI